MYRYLPSIYPQTKENLAKILNMHPPPPPKQHVTTTTIFYGASSIYQRIVVLMYLDVLHKAPQ